MGQEFFIDKKVDAEMRTPGLSDRAVALAIAGSIGLLLSIGLAMSLFLRYISASALIALTIYAMGVMALIVLTAGRARFWAIWPVRLLLPLPASLFIWWILSLFGL